MLAITAGISGFIGKSVEKNELLQAIEVIAKGKKYFSQEITSIITEHYYTMKNSNFELTERENEILKYIGRGRSNEQIGDLLNLSEKTVATHKRNVMKKIGVKKTSELILWALDNGIISKRII
jgi:DNA-binding NarL/FixJ family response regulator